MNAELRVLAAADNRRVRVDSIRHDLILRSGRSAGTAPRVFAGVDRFSPRTDLSRSTRFRPATPALSLERPIQKMSRAKARLGDRLLRPAILVLEVPQPLRLIRRQAAELRSPAVEGLPIDAVGPAELVDFSAGLALVQDPDDLFVRKSTP